MAPEARSHNCESIARVMRVLITGAGGQLGSDFQRLLPRALAYDRGRLSIADRKGVTEALRAGQPDVVINCAAYNAVDRAEVEIDAAREANALGPAVLARACLEFGARLIHFSTNFVFAGDLDRPYRESDTASPRGIYATTKRAGEIAVLELLPDALVIRSSGLFGSRGSAIKGGSFPERILRRARDGQPVRVVADQFLNPTYTKDLAEATLELLESQVAGVVHLVPVDCCSFLELAQATLDLAGEKVTAETMTTDQLGLPAPRPANGCLASERVMSLRPWREGLADLIRELEPGAVG